MRSHSVLVEKCEFWLVRMLSQYESHIKKRCCRRCSVSLQDPRHKVSSICSTFRTTSFSLKDICALGGGRARSCTSLEMRYTCLTKVTRKQKRNPIENMLLLPWHRSACVCHKHASLPSKSIFKEHFGRPANILFSSGNVQNNLVLPSLFLWFECWIINGLSTLPHQAQHTQFS